jgi:hypothetical protein
MRHLIQIASILFLALMGAARAEPMARIQDPAKFRRWIVRQHFAVQIQRDGQQGRDRDRKTGGKGNSGKRDEDSR